MRHCELYPVRPNRIDCSPGIVQLHGIRIGSILTNNVVRYLLGYSARSLSEERSGRLLYPVFSFLLRLYHAAHRSSMLLVGLWQMPLFPDIYGHGLIHIYLVCPAPAGDSQDNL